MSSYKITKIENITDFLKIIENTKQEAESVGNNAELLFRGQNIDKPLVPKLARLTLKGSIEGTEKLMLEEFRRGIIPLTEFKPEDDWDLLALAQHHGLPTRLLDWTYNSLIALWFAVNEPAKKNEKGKEENGVVWILSGVVDDFRAETEKFGPLSNKITKIYRPKVVSRRIAAQAGAFTVHKINDGGRMIKFETNKRYGKKLIKVVVSPKDFKSFRKSLSILGINSSTVFPDLDGFCKHLERRFSKQKDE
jgi:FRG domain